MSSSRIQVGSVQAARAYADYVTVFTDQTERARGDVQRELAWLEDRANSLEADVAAKCSALDCRLTDLRVRLRSCEPGSPEWVELHEDVQRTESALERWQHNLDQVRRAWDRFAPSVGTYRDAAASAAAAAADATRDASALVGRIRALESYVRGNG